MSFVPWMLAAMDEAGYNGIRDEHIDAVANELRRTGETVIDTEAFNAACRRCGIEPENFTQRDLDRLQDMLDW